MKRATAWLVVLVGLIVCVFLIAAFYHSVESEDRTLSPYFFIKSADPGIDRFPLKSTFASVNISWVIANVQARR